MKNKEFLKRLRARNTLWVELVGAGKAGLQADELDARTVRDLAYIDFAHMRDGRVYVGPRQK